MKRASLRILLCALLLALPARRARADDEGDALFIVLLPVLIGVVIAGVVDIGAVVGGTVSMFGTATTLSDEQPDETWRDASLGFGAITIAGGALWTLIAADSDWSTATTAIVAAHFGIGVVNIALAIASHQIGVSAPELVPVAGVDVNHQPFFGAGVQLATF